MTMKGKSMTGALFFAGLMLFEGCGRYAVPASAERQCSAAAVFDVQAAKDELLSALFSTGNPVSTNGGIRAETTLDRRVQRIVSETLPRHADTNDTGRGWAVVMSVEDGAVLALAECGGEDGEPRPFALARVFGPGHLLSTLTAAAAFDARIATPNTKMFTSAMEAFYYEYKLPRDGGHVWESTLTISNALAYSSNVVLSKLGIIVGRDKLYDVLDKCGIGRRSGIGLKREPVGRLIRPERWCRLQQTRIPIGQGVEITSIQIARAYATLANHGRRVDPYVVRRITDATGATLYEHVASTNQPQTISSYAADNTCAILAGAVKADDLKGFAGAKDKDPPDVAKCFVSPRPTGWRAAVEGVRVAGKTSTVQRLKDDGRNYETDKYTASFAGFFPAESPKYVIVVCFETKRNENAMFMHFGGGRPAMAFAEIVKSMSR